MSLINDALRRAKDAQRQTAAADGPKVGFRPLGRAPASAIVQRRTWVTGVLFGGAGLLGGILIWQSERLATISRVVEVNARPAVTSGGPTKLVPQAASAFPSSRNAAAIPAEHPDQSQLHESFAGFAEQTGSEPSQALPPLAPPVAAKPVAAALVTRERAPLKLQAIVYHPTRPSAIINGKTVFVGDSVAGMRLAVVTRQSATLIGGGITKVLELDQ